MHSDFLMFPPGFTRAFFFSFASGKPDSSAPGTSITLSPGCNVVTAALLPSPAPIEYQVES